MQRGWNSPFLFLFHPLYQTTLFTKTNIYPPFWRSCFSKINMVQFYTTPLNTTMTTIFLTSKSYGGIKLVWSGRISTWLKLFKYINLTQNEIIIFALMHNIRTHPFYFWYTLYTQAPFFNSKTYKPTLLPFFRSFQTHPF